MKGDNLPSSDHVAKYCKPTQIPRQNGHPIGVDKDAFKLKAGETDGISTDWLESFGRSDLVANLRAAELRLKASGYQVKKKGVLAVGQCSKIIHAGELEGAVVAVIEDPFLGNSAHALIIGIDPEADLVQEAIARAMQIFEISVT